jgi:WD40 repeat protein
MFRLIQTKLPQVTSELSVTSIACVTTEHVLASLDNGILASYSLNKDGRQTAVQFYQLLRSRQPFPKNEQGVVPISAAWGWINITRTPSPKYDQVEFVFALQGGNKVYRTNLPTRSLVTGFFGGAPVEIFASTKEAISCLTVNTSENRHGVLGTGSTDGVAMVWNLAHSMGDRGDPNLLTVGAHVNCSVSAMTFVKNNHLVVTASHDQAVRVWRVSDGELLQSLATGNMPVSDISCRCEGLSLVDGWTNTMIVAGTSTGSVFCWNLTHEVARTDSSGTAMFEEVVERQNNNNNINGGGSEIKNDDPMTTKSRLVAMSDHSAHEILHLHLNNNDLIVADNNGMVRHFTLILPKGSTSADLNVISVHRPPVKEGSERNNAASEEALREDGLSILSNNNIFNAGLPPIEHMDIVTQNGHDIVVYHVNDTTSQGASPLLQVLYRIKNYKGVDNVNHDPDEIAATPDGMWNQSVLALETPAYQMPSMDNTSADGGEWKDHYHEDPRIAMKLKKKREEEEAAAAIAKEKAEAAIKKVKEEEEKEHLPRRRKLPQPEIHPSVRFQSWQKGHAKEELSGINILTKNDADRWASREFTIKEQGDDGDKERGGVDGVEGRDGRVGVGREDAFDAIVRRGFCTSRENATNKTRRFINGIGKSFGNPRRAAALAHASEIERKRRQIIAHQESGGDGERKNAEIRDLGYHGGDPPYFSSTVHPISELQEPTLHSTKNLKVNLIHNSQYFSKNRGKKYSNNYSF